MKVVVKKDRVPIVLMIIGSAFVVVSSLSDHVVNPDHRKYLFPLGFILLVLGFVLWAVPSLVRQQKKRSKKGMVQSRGPPEGADQPRRYARPRR